MRKSMFLLTLILVLALAAGSAWADAVIGLTTFTSGTPAIAASVNANFAEILDSVDDNHSRITTLESAMPRITTLESTMPGVMNALWRTARIGTVGIYKDLASVTINAPADGYVLAMLSGSVSMTHTNGTISKANISVSKTSETLTGVFPTNFTIWDAMPNGVYNTPFSWSGIFAVNAGANTFYSVVFWGGGVVSATFQQDQFNLLFVPNAYGTVIPN